MTNFEKYKDEILRIATESNGAPAMEDGMLTACRGLSCEECDFNEDNCVTSFFNWLYEDDREQELTCSSCKHASRDQEEYPCSRCSRGYTDLFEPKPKKTRQDEFLERYPNARKRNSNGVLDICPKGLDMRLDCKFAEGCDICCQNYWLQEVEE